MARNILRNLLIIGCFLFFLAPSLLGAEQKKKSFCALCQKIYISKTPLCSRDGFPLVLATKKERTWIFKERKKLSRHISELNFYGSFHRHLAKLKKQKSPAIQASYYAVLEKYARFTQQKYPDFGVAFLSRILRREKKQSPYYKRAAEKILHLWWRGAKISKTPSKKRTYLWKVIRSPLFSEKIARHLPLYTKAEEELSKSYFRKGLGLLKKGINQDSFAHRFMAEQNWKILDSLWPDKKKPFYRFVKTCRLYFDLEAFYHLKKRKLVREVVNQMERGFRKYPQKEFPPSALPFWKTLQKIKKEL